MCFVVYIWNLSLWQTDKIDDFTDPVFVSVLHILKPVSHLQSQLMQIHKGFRWMKALREKVPKKKKKPSGRIRKQLPNWAGGLENT